MTDNDQQKTLLTRYLLGQVSVEERAELEDRYLNDDDLFETLVAAENDMIDAYVRGKLAEPEKQQFESYFLCTPERRERVELAEALVKAGAATGQPRTGWPVPLGGAQTPAMRLALATLLLAAVIGLSWMAAVNRKLHRQLEEVQGEQANARRQAQELQQQVAALQQRANASQDQLVEAPAPGKTILSLALASDLPRGRSQQTTLHLSAGISQVRLLLRQAREGPGAHAVILETAEGRQVWQKAGLEAKPARGGGQVVTVEISPAVLERGDYVLRLFRTVNGKAVEVGPYTFRVVGR